MTNRHKAAVILQDLSTHLQVINRSVGEIAGFIELAHREARDLTSEEMDVVLNMIIECQPKIKVNTIRNIIYGD